jgi:signal peptidase I
MAACFLLVSVPGRERQAGGECNKAREVGSNSLAARDMHPRQPPRRPAAARGCSPYTARLVTRRHMLGCLVEIVETLVLTLIIFFVIQTFVAQPYKVQQQSMEHTLEPDQYVLVDKLTPRFDTYKRGDIVVFTPPDDWLPADGTPFIKRVIGLGGDTVEIRDGSVFINGTKLDEPYLFAQPPGAQPQPTTVSGDTHRWVISAGDVFLMGDHRENSEDSRTFGEVAVSKIIGRAWLRYWPLSSFGVLPTPTYPELAPTAE